MDQEWSSSGGCGTTFNWVDLKAANGGNVFIHLRDGAVFQIDAATTSFHMQDGLTINATPEQVRKRYAGLRTYILSNGTSEAEGGRPLVYWVDQNKGLAFAFGYYRRKKLWYLYHIIVFEPGAEICPQPEPLSSSDKRELAPYSLDPSAR